MIGENPKNYTYNRYSRIDDQYRKSQFTTPALLSLQFKSKKFASSVQNLQAIRQDKLVNLNLFEDGRKDLAYLRSEEANICKEMSYLDNGTTKYETLKKKLLKIQEKKSQIQQLFRDNKVSLDTNFPIFSDYLFDQPIDQNQQMAVIQQYQLNYNPSNGFNLIWDFLWPIPPIYRKIQIYHGYFSKTDNIFINTNNVKPTLERDLQLSRKCYFQTKESVQDIKADYTNLLYIELWLWNTSATDLYEPPTVKLWTVLELFDLNDNFLAGKFRLPLYSDEFNPYMLFKNKLEYYSSLGLHVRICVPNDPDLDFIVADFKAHEYMMPDIHMNKIKSIFQIMKERDAKRRRMLEEYQMKQEYLLDKGKAYSPTWKGHVQQGWYYYKGNQSRIKELENEIAKNNKNPVEYIPRVIEYDRPWMDFLEEEVQQEVDIRKELESLQKQLKIEKEIQERNRLKLQQQKNDEENNNSQVDDSAVINKTIGADDENAAADDQNNNNNDLLQQQQQQDFDQIRDKKSSTIKVHVGSRQKSREANEKQQLYASLWPQFNKETLNAQDKEKMKQNIEERKEILLKIERREQLQKEELKQSLREKKIQKYKQRVQDVQQKIDQIEQNKVLLLEQEKIKEVEELEKSFKEKGVKFRQRQFNINSRESGNQQQKLDANSGEKQKNQDHIQVADKEYNRNNKLTVKFKELRNFKFKKSLDFSYKMSIKLEDKYLKNVKNAAENQYDKDGELLISKINEQSLEFYHKDVFDLSEHALKKEIDDNLTLINIEFTIFNDSKKQQLLGQTSFQLFDQYGAFQQGTFTKKTKDNLQLVFDLRMEDEKHIVNFNQKGKGFKIKITKLSNYIQEKSIFAQISMVSDKGAVLDDNGKIITKNFQDQPQKPNQKSANSNNKDIKNKQLQINYEHKIKLDFNNVKNVKYQRSYNQIYVIISLFTVEQNGQQNLLGWIPHPYINLNNGLLNQGLFSFSLYEQPQAKPPFEGLKFNKIKEIIEFEIIDEDNF